MEISEEQIAQKYNIFGALLDEHLRRLWAASEVLCLGQGGLALVSRATGISSNTIKKGIKELEEGVILPAGRIRSAGGGRKTAIENDPALLKDLDLLIEPTTGEAPESPLRWTCKSTRKLSEELNILGHKTSHRLIHTLLHQMGFSLKANQKIIESNQHHLRNEQFKFISQRVTDMQWAGDPVISVDTKKKEPPDNFVKICQKPEQTEKSANTHTSGFHSPNLEPASSYEALNLNNNLGSVNVGPSYDTASFAVPSIRAWWLKSGCEIYKGCSRLLITTNGDNSNSCRSRLWKWELQKLSEEIGLPISICHFPPGTSKWNRATHRLFSFITFDWRGRHLLDHETIVSLIRTTSNGLQFKCCLDRTSHKTDQESFNSINIDLNQFQGNWNYTISPRK